MGSFRNSIGSVKDTKRKCSRICQDSQEVNNLISVQFRCTWNIEYSSEYQYLDNIVSYDDKIKEQIGSI